MTNSASHQGAALPNIDRDDYRVISVLGEFDMANVSALESVLDRALESGRIPALDFSHTRYIDSSVLNLIVRKSGRSSRRVRLIVPAGCPIRRIFDITGLGAALGAVESVHDLD
jgi:anti-anti-sigma factor